MPELPEVETTKRGIAPHIQHRILKDVIIRQAHLRWPIPVSELATRVGEQLISIDRRGKYLLFQFEGGIVLAHLGMSGNMRIVQANEPVKKHDHVDMLFDNGLCLRLNDPRRFGALLHTTAPPDTHPLLAKLGPEPLSDDFSVDYLFKQSRKKSTNIKTFIMNSHVVVGVGNIYASESLFLAGIKPTTMAGKISKERFKRLVHAIKTVLVQSIEQGGTTLKDFVNSDGKPGYFKQSLNVYGRAGEPCHHCGSSIKEIKQTGRATYFCPKCQR